MSFAPDPGDRPPFLTGGFGLAVAAVVAIGGLDYVTGPLWSMSVFYLVPTAWAAAAGGRQTGLILAALSGVSGVVSDVMLQPHSPHRGIAAGTAAIMFVTLVVVVELVNRVRSAALAAREAEQQGREFLALAAHQLRTPLAVIRSTTEALVVNDDAEDQEELLGGLARESARAGRLVTALLRVARLDQRGSIPLRDVDLVEVVRSEVDRASARKPGVAWCLEAPDGSAPLRCNPDSLSEAIAALLDNAGRHARTTVTVRVEHRGEAIVVAVGDDGPGLPPGSEASAFQRFVSLDGAGGTGLGLPIARGIAESHRGSLTYEDGAFVVSLPRLAKQGLRGRGGT
jgi:two-component system OmpR family sensor kinase